MNGHSGLMINIHWFPNQKLSNLMSEGKLYHGKAATVQINCLDALHGQIVRKSVWTKPENVGVKGESSR